MTIFMNCIICEMTKINDVSIIEIENLLLQKKKNKL